MAQEIASLLETGLQIYRSKKVHFILTTQNMNLAASPIDLSNVQLKIFSYVSRAQANTNGIPLIYANRDDLKHGKFIYYKQGKCSLMRGLSYEK